MVRGLGVFDFRFSKIGGAGGFRGLGFVWREELRVLGLRGL